MMGDKHTDAQGELPELPEPAAAIPLTGGGEILLFTAEQMLNYGSAIAALTGRASQVSAAAPADERASKEYAFDEYQPGQWWLTELENHASHRVTSDDTRRAAGVALDFAAKVFASRASEGQAQTSVSVKPENPIECWSSDQEDFNAQSLGELIDCHGGLKAGDTVWIGEAVTPEPSQLIDGDDIITMIGERAYDIAGEHSEDYPDVNKDAEQELNDLLAGWISKHAHPTFWTVHNVKPYVLSHDDFPNDPVPVMCDVPDAAQLADSTGDKS